MHCREHRCKRCRRLICFADAVRVVVSRQHNIPRGSFRSLERCHHVRGRLAVGERNGLEIASISGGSESCCVELFRDIARGSLAAGRPRRTAFHLVGGEPNHVLLPGVDVQLSEEQEKGKYVHVYETSRAARGLP